MDMKSTILINFFMNHNGLKTHFADGGKTEHGHVKLITDDDIVEYTVVSGSYDNVLKACWSLNDCGWMHRSIFCANDGTYIIVITENAYGVEARMGY